MNANTDNVRGKVRAENSISWMFKRKIFNISTKLPLLIWSYLTLCYDKWALSWHFVSFQFPMLIWLLVFTWADEFLYSIIEIFRFPISLPEYKQYYISMVFKISILFAHD